MKKDKKTRKRVPYDLRNKLPYDRAACKRLEVMHLGMCNKYAGGDRYWDECCYYKDFWKKHHSYMRNFLNKHLYESTDEVKALLKSKLPLKNKDVFNQMWRRLVTSCDSDNTVVFLWDGSPQRFNPNVAYEFVDFDGFLLTKEELQLIIANEYGYIRDIKETANRLNVSDRFRKFCRKNGIDTSLTEEFLRDNNENML